MTNCNDETPDCNMYTKLYKTILRNNSFVQEDCLTRVLNEVYNW